MIYLVIPCYNEQEIIENTHRRLIEVLSGLTVNINILFVDDGSTDDTWDVIRKQCQQGAKGLRLAHNVGQQAALWAGMEACAYEAEAIITIDADLQDDINVIPRMIDDFKNGADVVCGIRSSRKSDSFMKRWSAQVYYRMLTALGCDTVYNHADFRMLSQRAVKALLAYSERNLYLRGMVPLLGFRTTYEYYDRQPRRMGSTKYSTCQMLALAFDGITSFSVRPLHLIFCQGILFILVSIVSIIWGIAQYPRGSIVQGWTFLLISLWFIGGNLLLAVGIIGEYIGKVYKEAKRRPRYCVMEQINM